MASIRDARVPTPSRRCPSVSSLNPSRVFEVCGGKTAGFDKSVWPDIRETKKTRTQALTTRVCVKADDRNPNRCADRVALFVLDDRVIDKSIIATNPLLLYSKTVFGGEDSQPGRTELCPGGADHLRPGGCLRRSSSFNRVLTMARFPNRR